MSVLRLLWQCDSMEWRHLPVAGGLYDQHPDFLEASVILKEARAKHEERKRKEEEAKSKREMNAGKTRRRR